MKITSSKDTVETIRIYDERASFANFVFNYSGQLFVHSDYGIYGYSFSSFVGDFKSFLSHCNVDYVLNKFDYMFKLSNGEAIP